MGGEQVLNLQTAELWLCSQRAGHLTEPTCPHVYQAESLKVQRLPTSQFTWKSVCSSRHSMVLNNCVSGRAVYLLSASCMQNILPGAEVGAKAKHHPCLQGTFGHTYMMYSPWVQMCHD